MKSESFLKEVNAFVATRWPDASWEIHPDFAVLYHDDRKKSICFLTNKAVSKMPHLPYRFYFIEALWYQRLEASQSRLCSILGITQRIHARQCGIARVSKPVAQQFVNTNHTMGYANCYYHFGLFLKEELVAIACFSKGRQMRRLEEGKKSYELIRFCSKNDFTVVGGLSKLIRHFENFQSPGDIMTYVDISWGEPHAYYALGFILDSITPPISCSLNIDPNTTIEYWNKGNYKLIKYE